MKKTLISLIFLVIAGCKAPAPEPAKSALNSAIENLSTSTEQMETLRREKEFFVKILEDFERQQTTDGNFINPRQVRKTRHNLARWHNDISRRERSLAAIHAFNVYAAQNLIAKQKSQEPNQISLAGPLPKP
jgi:hypothetical protein